MSKKDVNIELIGKKGENSSNITVSGQQGQIAITLIEVFAKSVSKNVRMAEEDVMMHPIGAYLEALVKSRGEDKVGIFEADCEVIITVDLETDKVSAKISGFGGDISTLILMALMEVLEGMGLDEDKIVLTPLFIHMISLTNQKPVNFTDLLKSIQDVGI